jgi:hypothetical protein
MPAVLSPKLSLKDQRKPGIFLMGRPKVLILCLDSSLLMQLKVIFTKNRKTRDRFLQGDSFHWMKNLSNLPVFVVLLESGPGEVQITI